MLRRLPEDHKQHALHILNSNGRINGSDEYDALYGLPHSDGGKPPWPSHDMINQLQRLK